MSVNKERVELLCQALESGEFEQVEGVMRARGRLGVAYCCLGVATMVALRSGDVSEDEVWTDPDNDDYGVLSPPVAEWYGFKSGEYYAPSNDRVQYDPKLRALDLDEHEVEVSTTASVMNDDRRASFQEIAEAFRRTYLEERP